MQGAGAEQKPNKEINMSKITYTFPADCAAPQLRGITCTGGEFRAISGKFSDPIDSVRFDTIIDGKRISAIIAGKPELEKLLADHKAAEAAKVAVLASIGWPEYQKVQSRAINASSAYDAASERGYPVKEATAMREAAEALDTARAQYPLAAAYAKAESYSMASHDQKASAGRRAMHAIESGADAITATKKMETEWAEAASRCVANA